jgi:hypothetical protein
MIDRQTDVRLVGTALRRSRVVALLGPRQCGKTTLARKFVSADSINYFDLEDPATTRKSFPWLNWSELEMVAQGCLNGGLIDCAKNRSYRSIRSISV